MRVTVVASLLAVAACQFDPPPPVGSDGGDTPPDALVDCTPDTITCEAGVYVDCGPDGVAETTMVCPLGCDDTEPRCVDIDPSNGVAQYLDRARTDESVGAVALGEGSTIDTDSGVVFDGTTEIQVPSIDVGDYRVFMVKNLQITGVTKVVGVDALIIVSDGDVDIADVIDVSADLSGAGPAANRAACAGGSTSGAVGIQIPGAGGAGNADLGGTGSLSHGGYGPRGTPGAALTDADLEPLVGGCNGGSGTMPGEVCQSHGGGGGGALQIVSRTRISFAGRGGVDASGGGGVSAKVQLEGCFSTSTRGGAGGGSGGAVLLEAPVITLDGSGVVLSTKGGSGSAGGIGLYDGSDGGLDEAPAEPGLNLSTGVAGGAGGTEALPPEPGEDGDTAQNGGGGGGAVGRARFNTATGEIVQSGGAVMRTRHTTSIVRTRLVP